MNCPNCGEYISEGNFCTNCGTQITEESVAASSEPNASQPASVENTQDMSQTVESGQTEAKPSLDITGYYVNLIKKPIKAMESTANDLIPGIITLVVFALLYGAQSYYTMNELSGGYMSVSFTMDFLQPFLRFGLILVIAVAITFGALKLTAHELPFQDVFAKYTAFLIPFTLLYAVGFILNIISLPTIPDQLTSLSSSASLIMIPAIIILNSKRKEFDLVYLLIGVFAVTYIINAFLSQALVSILS